MTRTHTRVVPRRKRMRPGYYTQLFDARVDFDTEGCSISLDLDIEELVADDFGDHTIMSHDLPEPMRASIVGVGIQPRAPAVPAVSTTTTPVTDRIPTFKLNLVIAKSRRL